MTNSVIEYKVKRNKYLNQVIERYRPSFKELSKKWQTPRFKRINLPDTKIYPDQWTYLVSNEKRPHTITVDEFRKKKIKETDKVYFERGQIYNWAGYDPAANNLTFGSFGAGVDPKFYGSSELTSWTSETGGYYSASLATAPKWVAINDECARQGESDWIPTTGAGSSTTLVGSSTTLDAFNAVESLVGAKVRVKEFNFRLSYEHLITGYSSGTITIAAGGVSIANIGLPFKLYGQKQFATLEGDWWYDDANNELWIKAASSPTNVRVITEDYAFKVDGFSNVTFENIDFTQYFESAIECPDSPNVTVNNVDVSDTRQNAFMFYGNNTTFTLSNFTIQRSGLNGVHLGAVTSGTISDGTIDEIGLQDNIGWPVDTYWIKTGGTGVCCFWDSGESITQPDSVDMSNVTMSNLGYIGVLWIGDDHTATECVVHDFCLKWNDGAAFYSVHRASLGTSTKNITYTRCVGYNGYGGTEGITGAAGTPPHASGLYVDNGSELITVNECIFHDNNDFGILCNWDTQKTTITNCIVFGNANSQVRYTQDTDALDSPVFPNNDGNVLTGNLIVAADLSYCVEIVSFNSDAAYNPFSDSGSIDNNTYVRPYGVTINARRTTNTGIQTPYALAAWQTQISGDASSTERYETGLIYRGPVHNRANTVRIAVNATASPISVDATGYFSITGAALGASESVAAWDALVYIAHSQTNPDQLFDTFTGANGTAIAGRAPAVGPTPTIALGTHAIQSNQLATSVNGALYWDINETDIDFTLKTLSNPITVGLNTYFRWVDASNRFVIAVTASSISLFEFNASASATNTWTLSAGVTFRNSFDYYFTIRAIGNSVKLWSNGRLMFDVTTSYTTPGSVGLLGSTGRTTDYVSSNTP